MRGGVIVALFFGLPLKYGGKFNGNGTRRGSKERANDIFSGYLEGGFSGRKIQNDDFGLDTLGTIVFARG